MQPKKSRVMLIVAAGLVLITVLWFVAPLSIREMGSDSMKPLIGGQGSPPSKQGDRVLVLTSFFDPKEGDLVLIEIPTAEGAVETIRRIKSIERGAKVRFVVESIDPLGLDSRQFGSLPVEKLRGKILHIFKS